MFPFAYYCRSVSTQSTLFAGHSKWANIRHIKAAKDGEKAATFTKLSRQIRLAIQEGGTADINMNSQLKSLVDEALRKNMPMSTIQNNIKKNVNQKGQLKKYQLEMRYKQKVFAICVLYTDNFPAVKMEMATILRKCGAVFMDCNYIFNNFGLIEATARKGLLEHNDQLEDKAMDDAIECGAEDVQILNANTGSLHFTCSPIEINTVSKLIEAKGYNIENTEHVFVPKSFVDLTGDDRKNFEVFLQKIRNVAGVENVFDNLQYAEGD